MLPPHLPDSLEALELGFWVCGACCFQACWLNYLCWFGAWTFGNFWRMDICLEKSQLLPQASILKRENTLENLDKLCLPAYAWTNSCGVIWTRISVSKFLALLVENIRKWFVFFLCSEVIWLVWFHVQWGARLPKYSLLNGSGLVPDVEIS